MGALIHSHFPRPVIIWGTALCALAAIAPLARGQQEVAWHGSPTDWLRDASVTTSAASGSFAPAAGATQQTTDCDDGCCCGYCCNMCPCAYGVVEALVLQRNISGSAIPLVVDATTGNALLTTNDLSFPFSGGLRAYYGRQFRDCWYWEAGYFGLWGANASATASGNLSLPGDFSGLNVFFGADQVLLDYTTNLNGVEFNLANCFSSCDTCGCRTTCDSVQWLFGLRYLRIDDTLDIGAQRAEEGGLETGSYNVRAVNNLYGGQVGARLRRCWGLWSVEGTGKAGLYYNDATQRQTVVDFPNFVVRDTSSADSNLAFLGELNASLIRQITDVWYVRAGYNLIWIDGIALAPNQLDFTLTGTSGTATNTGGTMFLHGANFGVEARW